MLIYHHTSLAHLPYILTEGALVQTKSRDEWPDDFVWATENANGDRTTGVCRQKDIPRIRIALRRHRFLPWLKQVEASGWPDGISVALERMAQGMGQGDTSGWWAANERVPVADFLSIEMKTWNVPWQGIRVDELLPVADDWIQFRAGGEYWKAKRARASDGPLMYVVLKVM